MLIKRREAEEVVNMIWKYFDTDNSGFIELDEAKDMFEFLFINNKDELNKHTLEELFKSVDANGDQKLSKDEVVDMLLTKV